MPDAPLVDACGRIHRRMPAREIVTGRMERRAEMTMRQAPASRTRSASTWDRMPPATCTGASTSRISSSIKGRLT